MRIRRKRSFFYFLLITVQYKKQLVFSKLESSMRRKSSRLPPVRYVSFSKFNVIIRCKTAKRLVVRCWSKINSHVFQTLIVWGVLDLWGMHALTNNRQNIIRNLRKIKEMLFPLILLPRDAKINGHTIIKGTFEFDFLLVCLTSTFQNTFNKCQVRVLYMVCMGARSANFWR